MSRLQLALNVDDLEEGIAFYSRLFRTLPSKVRDGYANFAIDNPPLKLILFENGGENGSINHLGIEVESTEMVQESIAHLDAEGFVTEIEQETSCCFAVQDKVWVAAPDGNRWEVYTVLSDDSAVDTETGCCVPETLAIPLRRPSTVRQ